MQRPIKTFTAVLLAASAAASASAGASFEASMAKCLDRYANTRDAAVVMLECTADAGKLSNCKVLENSTAGKGFDKAAMCVAEVLPMNGRTGQVKVPFRFTGGA